MLEGLVAEGQVCLDTLEAQLEILSLHGADAEGGKVEGRDLPFAGPDLPTEQGYLLTDALLSGETDRAFGLLQRFLAGGSPPLLILSRIGWEIRKIWILQEAMREGRDLEPVLAAARIPRFKQRTFVGLARSIPAKALERVFRELREKDRKLKSSRLDGRWHLEELCRSVLEAAGAGTRAGASLRRPEAPAGS